MTITLLAVSLNDHPLSQPITASFDVRGGSIGRADYNTMALPDPERHISRLQAEIKTSGGGFFIRNMGAANPISVAGRALAAGEAVLLCHDNEVRIGGYLLRVIDESQVEGSGAEITRGRAKVRESLAAGPAVRDEAKTSPPPPAAAVISVLLPSSGSTKPGQNPFADLLTPPPDSASRLDPSARSANPGGPSTPDPSSDPSVDPFAGLVAPPSGLTAESAALRHDHSPARPFLPSDFDVFAAPAAPARPQSVVADDPFSDLMPSAANASLDEAFGLGANAPAGDALARFFADANAMAAPNADIALSTDPMAMFGASAAPAGMALAPVRDHSPNLNAAFNPPRWGATDEVAAATPAATSPELKPTSPSGPPASAAMPIPADATWLRPPLRAGQASEQPSGQSLRARPPEVDVSSGQSAGSPEPASASTPSARAGPSASAPLAKVQTAVAASTPSETADALWSAFCEGAGTPIHLPQGLNAETMRVLGQLLEAAVAGTLQLVAVRATTKQEMRADLTLIQQRANNPLKFMPDASAGLEQLINPPMRGFMAGPAAMTDAMHDLLGHSIGTMAGMRAALDGVMQRFTPTELEGKLSGKSMLDSVLPMNRKARLWDLYLQHFATIREDAKDDFHTLFGKAFLAAYEQQLARLRAAPGSSI